MKPQAHAAVKEYALRAHPWANTTRRFSPDPFSFGKKDANPSTIFCRAAACSCVTRKFVPRAHRRIMDRKNWRPAVPSLIVAFLLALCPVAQSQDLLWAKRAGGLGFAEGRGMAVDVAGNSYVTGLFNGSAIFGPGEANETMLTSAGGSTILNIFVAQYDTDGLLVWAKRAGGSTHARGLGIAVDVAGNSYVTGFFEGSATFGPGEPNETMLTSFGNSDVFVARYDNTGLLVWAKRAGGLRLVQGVGIAVDEVGNSYVTGLFQGLATFGLGEANETTLTADSGGANTFLAKYDTAGLLVWARRAGGFGLGPNDDGGVGIAVDAAGNSYVTGSVQEGATTLNIFVAEYDTAGLLVWSKRASGSLFVQGYGIAVDGAGNSHVTGLFKGSATFGSGEANETKLTSASGLSDIFVAEYDASGLLVWAKRAGGPGSGSEGDSIAVDGAGNSYVTGLFYSSATFGPGEANETTLTSAGGDTNPNIFVAKYDTAGLLAWARRAGGSGLDEGRGIAVDAVGISYVAGFFQGSATFGPGEASETTLTSFGNGDVFVAKYGGGSP